MLRVDPEALAAYSEEADQRQARLKDQKVFRGTVTAVSGAQPKVSVEVSKTGEGQSSPVAHLVASTWDPKIGDQTDIYWRDQQAAIAVPVGAEALARMPARHPYWWHFHNSTSPGVAAGWVPVTYSVSDDDPSSVYGNGAATIPVDGTYLVIVKGATTANLDMTTGLWKNGSQIDQGDYSNSQRGSVCPVVRRFLKGDLLVGYVWTSAGGTLDGGSPFHNVFEGCLLSRG
jgi:hypothetical protein